MNNDIDAFYFTGDNGQQTAYLRGKDGSYGIVGEDIDTGDIARNMLLNPTPEGESRRFSWTGPSVASAPANEATAQMQTSVRAEPVEAAPIADVNPIAAAAARPVRPANLGTGQLTAPDAGLRAIMAKARLNPGAITPDEYKRLARREWVEPGFIAGLENERRKNALSDRMAYLQASDALQRQREAAAWNRDDYWRAAGIERDDYWRNVARQNNDRAYNYQVYNDQQKMEMAAQAARAEADRYNAEQAYKRRIDDQRQQNWRDEMTLKGLGMQQKQQNWEQKNVGFLESAGFVPLAAGSNEFIHPVTRQVVKVEKNPMEIPTRESVENRNEILRNLQTTTAGAANAYLGPTYYPQSVPANAPGYTQVQIPQTPTQQTGNPQSAQKTVKNLLNL